MTTSNRSLQFVTIGVYGTTADAFFEALQTAGVDTFVDVRQRRGVRGAKYAFVNSKRLQARLAELGIRYLHRKDLAPTKAIREQQYAVDKLNQVGKRNRSQLGDVFITAYHDEILSEFDPQTLLADLPDDAQTVALFCVERDAEACHRSLVAARLAETLGVTIQHLMPESNGESLFASG